jgi:N-acetylglucosaminyldiphosphoundecaprenol N-acetyl-beta-D-mannosaminyltransferase
MGLKMSADHVTVFERNIRRVKHSDFDNLVADIAGGPAQSVFFCNVHMLMLSQEDSALAAGMDATAWVFADSAPVAWMQRRLTGLEASVIPGYEILLAACRRAELRGERVGFMGSTPEVLQQLVRRILRQFPGLSVSFEYAPPYMEGELVSGPDEIQRIKDSKTDWLFVGLGCPKQEKWSARYAHELDCHVLAVGAAFDWLAGTSAKPADWMEKYGLAWVYRLMQNPRRMWHRYLIYNSKFVFKSAKTLGWDKLDSTRKSSRR